MADFDPDQLLTAPAPDSATMKITPAAPTKLSYDDMVRRAQAQGYSPAGARGIADNFTRESGGNPAIPGDDGTSLGLAQWHNVRKAALLAFAKEQGKPATDPDVQFQFLDKEMREQYPALREALVNAKDQGEAEEQFKRIFERPASVLWANNAQGRPVLGNDRFRFADDALDEWLNKDDAEVHYMEPKDYLVLSPSMDDDPGHSLSGWRDLRSSLAKGEPVKSIPTLDLTNGKVTGQDGRSRALLAQMSGIDAIPVAMRGDKSPEVQGAGGAVIPTRNFVPANQMTAEKGDGGSIVGRMLGISPAHAEETATPKYAVGEEVPEPAQTYRVGEEVADPNPNTTIPGVSGAVTRGLAPYAAGAAAGAALGAPIGGIGAIPGAAAGAGAVGLTQLATGIYNMIADKMGWSKTATPQEMTDKVLDAAGVKRPETPIERVTEATVGGMASGFTGAGAAKVVADGAAKPLTKAIAGAMAENPELQAVSGGSGGEAQQIAAEAGLPEGWQQMAGFVAALIPGAKGLLPGTGRINASPMAKKAIEAGFVLPPAEASEGHIGQVNLTNMAAAEAGKIKLGQLASAKNQPLVNLYAQKDLGLDPGTTLTPQVFKNVRTREGQVYQEVVNAVPEVDLRADPQFRVAAENVGNRSATTEKLFPSTKEPPGVAALRSEMIANARAPTQSVMDYIANLRSQATANFHAEDEGAAMAHRMGAAQRQAANVLEDAMERSIQNAPDYYRSRLADAQKFRDAVYKERAEQGLPIQGQIVDEANADVKQWSDRLATANAKNQDNQSLIDRFRKARQTMAKSYDVESVTNVSTGDVSAHGLGKLLQDGKPLTGDLKLIADSANSFSRAFQNPAKFGGVESMSVLDVGAGAITAGELLARSHPVAAGIAAAAPVIRPLTRARVLSPGYQRRMILPPPAARVPLSAITTPFTSPSPIEGATQGMTP
jgi:Phage tail lysozyme